jgi:hypothetical protein
MTAETCDIVAMGNNRRPQPSSAASASRGQFALDYLLRFGRSKTAPLVPTITPLRALLTSATNTIRRLAEALNNTAGLGARSH